MGGVAGSTALPSLPRWSAITRARREGAPDAFGPPGKKADHAHPPHLRARSAAALGIGAAIGEAQNSWQVRTEPLASQQMGALGGLLVGAIRQRIQVRALPPLNSSRRKPQEAEIPRPKSGESACRASLRQQGSLALQGNKRKEIAARTRPKTPRPAGTTMGRLAALVHASARAGELA